jgi:hypothetical protein
MGKCNAWIGFDLDGTLAHYDEWRGAEHIGEPIYQMIELVKQYISKGQTVKIFTARACIASQIPFVERWLEVQGIGGLEVTNIKDFDMTVCYDDRCKQVIPNKGILVEDVLDLLLKNK